MLVDFAKHVLLSIGLQPILLPDALYLYVSPSDEPRPLLKVARVIGEGDRIDIDEWATFMDEYSRGFHR